VLLGGATLAVTTFAIIDVGRSGPGVGVACAGVCAVALGVAFVAVERRRRDPMLPPELFRRPAFTAANLVAGAMNLGTLGLLFVLTLYLQQVQGRTPLASGLLLLPLFLPLSVLAPLGGRLTARVGSRWPMTAGLVISAIGIALLTALGSDSGVGLLLPALLLWGIGLGLLTPAVVAAAVGAVPATRAGLGSAVNNASRQACGAIGIAAFGALAGRGILTGLHVSAAVAAGLFAAAAAASAAVIRP
jgi:MFS transporter, DHA2 family, methylenomycin A resistance protein